MAEHRLREKARTFPRQPGCYLWRDRDATVLYVGKAQDLRARVLQYFGSQEDARKQRMVEEAHDVEFLAVDSVTEALVLEQTLIKRHRPRYNVLMMDDKKYPYIAVTQEAWPRVVYTRNLNQPGAFFGPFPDAFKAKRVARMLNQTFKLRQCRNLPTRSCLYYHLDQCTAPCIDAVSKRQYQDQADAAREFLQGRADDLARKVQDQMEQAARQMRFEQAAELRDLRDAIGTVLERQRVDRPGGDDYDAVGLATQSGRWCALVLWVRGGAVVGRESYTLSAPDASASPEVLAAFLEQFYGLAPDPPRRVLLPVPVPGLEELAATLEAVHSRPIRFQVPERGAKRQFVQLAEKNAALLLEQEMLMRDRQGPDAMARLRDALDLPDLPSRIECFDISHHAGDHTVASMVVFIDGAARKGEYRKFKIRTTSGGDDPGAMREAVQRRYRRVLDESGADALPDLVVVDGGPTQLSAAREGLAELGLTEMPIIGLAKKREEIYRPKQIHPLRLDPADAGLHLLQRARDEAHRFAIRYQGTLKRKAFVKSALDEIQGIGPERRKRLLTTFGSVEGVRKARVEEIAAVPGMTRPLARRVRDALGPSQDSSPKAE